MDTHDSLGGRIRHLRGATSQADFAHTFGINQNTLSRYERNERIPDAEFIALLCKTLGISPVWVLFGIETMEIDTPQTQKASVPSAEFAACPRCVKLEEKMERVEQQRDELFTENRQLWRENSALQARCATLEERQRLTTPDGVFSKQASILSNNALTDG